MQAISGLTFSSGLPGREPAGWGYSYMDHTGAYYMAIATLLALLHKQRTGEGQWVDLSCTEAGLTLHGPALLDWGVNGRPMRRPGSPHANRSEPPAMAPHGIYPAQGDDEWVAIACRSDAAVGPHNLDVRARRARSAFSVRELLTGVGGRIHRDDRALGQPVARDDSRAAQFALNLVVEFGRLRGGAELCGWRRRGLRGCRSQ